jgi:Flp pilus assembly protein CpaB
MPSLKRNRTPAVPRDELELEYHQPGKRRKIFIVLGVFLAIAAGGAAFVLINNAQQQGGTVATKPVIVAARDIPARTVLQTSDLTIRNMPDDPSLLTAITQPDQVVGRVTGVALLMQQPILPNLLLSSTAGGQFSILRPEETLAPDAPHWRAVSVNVPDDRAVGGQIQSGQQVDLFVTVQVNVVIPTPAPGRTSTDGNRNNGFYTDKSTKVTYQDVVVLAKNGTFYILRVQESMAEEISHLQAAGNAMFSIALRPEGDHRTVDTKNMGETTNKIIQEYKLPIPEIYPKP